MPHIQITNQIKAISLSLISAAASVVVIFALLLSFLLRSGLLVVKGRIEGDRVAIALHIGDVGGGARPRHIRKVLRGLVFA